MNGSECKEMGLGVSIVEGRSLIVIVTLTKKALFVVWWVRGSYNEGCILAA